MSVATTAERVLVLACGALAREVLAVVGANGWEHVTVRCLPAELHSAPKRIAPAVDEQLTALRGRYDRAFVAYADCGTSGALDRVLARHGVERLPGAHCYAVFAGLRAWDALQEEEPGTFYVTDFLARHFDALVVRPLGLDRYPELQADIFGNYRRLVYLAQTDDPELLRLARTAAARLGLAFECRPTGYGHLASSLTRVAEDVPAAWRG
jgi:Protein of unknown function (DUF1638)